MALLGQTDRELLHGHDLFLDTGIVFLCLASCLLGLTELCGEFADLILEVFDFLRQVLVLDLVASALFDLTLSHGNLALELPLAVFELLDADDLGLELTRLLLHLLLQVHELGRFLGLDFNQLGGLGSKLDCEGGDRLSLSRRLLNCRVQLCLDLLDVAPLFLDFLVGLEHLLLQAVVLQLDEVDLAVEV